MKNKIDKPAIEAKVRALKEYEPQMVSSGWYHVCDKRSPLTALKGCNLQEAVSLLQKEYLKAARQFGCSTADVRLEKNGANACLTATRMETVDETEERIKQEVEWRISRIREDWARASNEKSRKKKQIEKLKAELEALEK